MAVPRSPCGGLLSYIGGGAPIHQPPILGRVSDAPDSDGPHGIEIVAEPSAPIGSGDISRRWGLEMPDGAVRFAGVTRPEGQAAATDLAAMDPATWDLLLVEVTLAVVLSDGAGPYLLDARGRLTLVLGPHRGISRAHVTMGDAGGNQGIGLTRRLDGGPVWEWIARAEVPPAQVVVALDALDELIDPSGVPEWERRVRG